MGQLLGQSAGLRDTHLPVPLIHDPGDLYLLPPHGCLLAGLSDASTISGQHDFFFHSLLAHCATLSSGVGSFLLSSSERTLRQSLQNRI